DGSNPQRPRRHPRRGGLCLHLRRRRGVEPDRRRRSESRHHGARDRAPQADIGQHPARHDAGAGRRQARSGRGTTTGPATHSVSVAGGAWETTTSGEGARTLTVADIAAAVGGELRGRGDVVVTAVAPIHRAGPRDLTFLASARYAALLASSRPGVVLVSPDLAETPGAAEARV